MLNAKRLIALDFNCKDCILGFVHQIALYLDDSVFETKVSIPNDNLFP